MSQRLSRRRILGSTAALAVLSAAGCSPISGSKSDNDNSTSGKPTRGGTLRIGRVSDIVSPDGNVGGEVQFMLLDNVYSTLIKLDSSLEPKPMLAKSWKLADDATDLTISLRTNVNFHDGKSLTSADVKYTIERVRDPKLGQPVLATFSKLVTGIETPDEHTVKLTFSRPLPNIFDFFELLYIVDEDTVEGSAANTAANGTGPFVLDEWQPGRRYVLKRNPKYWEDDRPYLDRVEVHIVPDAASMVVQLESGQLGAITDVPLREVKRLKSAGHDVVVSEALGSFYLAANVKTPELADPRVRRAINHAIDRKRFVDQILAGVGEASALPWPRTNPAYDAELNETMRFDLDEARRLLREAGVSSLELELSSNAGQAPLVQFGQILQSDLASIGVKLKVNNLEVPRWRERSSKASYKGLLSGPYALSNLRAASLFMLARPFRPDGNVSNFSSSEYSALVEDALLATDQKAEREAHHKLAEYLLKQSFVMPIATNNQVLAASSAVHGWGERRKNGGFALREVFTKE